MVPRCEWFASSLQIMMVVVFVLCGSASALGVNGLSIVHYGILVGAVAGFGF